MAVSVALHAAGAVWLALGGDEEAAAVTATRAPAPVIVDEPPVEVELVDAAAPAPARDGPGARSFAAVAAPIRAPAPRVLDAPPATDAPPAPWLAMRGAPDLLFHGELGAGDPAPHAARGPAVTGVDPDPPPEVAFAPARAPVSPDSGELDPRLTHEGFSLDVDPDGAAHLHDTRNLRFVLHLPTKKSLQQRLAAWHEELEDPPPDGGGYEPPPPHDREDAPRPLDRTLGSGGVTVLKFDVTDWLMRRHGSDPYASAKLDQLDATRDQRAQVGARHVHAQLAHAGELMQDNLDALWASTPDLAARKEALFALWDECAETGSEDIVAATAHARARVVKWIRERLPPGSRDAYTSDELAALARRRQSAAVFAPYADQ